MLGTKSQYRQFRGGRLLGTPHNTKVSLRSQRLDLEVQPTEREG